MKTPKTKPETTRRNMTLVNKAFLIPMYQMAWLKKKAGRTKANIGQAEHSVAAVLRRVLGEAVEKDEAGEVK